MASSKHAEQDVEMSGVIIGQFGCEVCTACGATFIDEEAMKLVEEKMKELHLFGTKRTV